jgi:ArsR family transcriptional regulator
MLLKYIDMYCKSPIDALSMLRGDLMNHTAPQRRPRPSLPLAIATTLAACCAPLTAATLAPQEAQATAALFRALADPHRVRIIVLGISQPTASHHLKKLVQAGSLDREQHGVWACFTRDHYGRQRLAAIADPQGGTP